MLQGKQVSKSFAGLKALSGVDFQVSKGEIVGLIGPNGSGKTTLFNVISGFLKPSEGKVTFEGESIVGRSPDEIADLGIGRTFQIVKPFPGITALQNTMVGTLYGRSNIKSIDEARRTASDLLDFVGLIRQKDIPVKYLPLALRKRLEVARALALKPKVLLLDEVMAGLNQSETNVVLKIIEQVRTERGIAVFVIEHNMRAVMQVSDRIMCLNYGQKICEGTPSEIVQDKAVVEAYLGSPYAGS